jgi:hypothetical protein
MSTRALHAPVRGDVDRLPFLSPCAVGLRQPFLMVHRELELPQSSPSVLPHRSLFESISSPKASKKLVANTPSQSQHEGGARRALPGTTSHFPRSLSSVSSTGAREEERRGGGTPALHSRSGSGASRAAGKFCAAASAIPCSHNLVGWCSPYSKRRRDFGIELELAFSFFISGIPLNLLQYAYP